MILGWFSGADPTRIFRGSVYSYQFPPGPRSLYKQDFTVTLFFVGMAQVLLLMIQKFGQATVLENTYIIYLIILYYKFTGFMYY